MDSPETLELRAASLLEKPVGRGRLSETVVGGSRRTLTADSEMNVRKEGKVNGRATLTAHNAKGRNHKTVCREKGGRKG